MSRFASSLPVKVGIIGCGAAFENLYLRPLRSMQRRGWIRVSALSETSPTRLRDAARAFPEARCATTPEAAWEDGIDLAILLSPPPQHRAHAEFALARGSNVLCEKPVADTVESAEAMRARAAECQRFLAVGQTRRFYPALATAKRILAAEELGKVVRYSYTEGGAYAWPITTAAPFRRSSSGGGVLLDKGVHALDVLCWLFGAAEVVAYRDDACGDGTECFAKLSLVHGAVAGHVILAWDQELSNSCLIEGTAGDLWLPTGPMHDLFRREKGGAWRRVSMPLGFAAEIDGPKRQIPRVYYECFELQLTQVLRAILHGEPVPVTAGEALIGLRVINEAYAKAEPTDQPWLSAKERSEFGRRHWRQGSAP